MSPNYNELRATAIESQKVDLNVIDCYKNLPVSEIAKKYVEESLPFAVCCLNILGDLNVSMILRTAATFGAEKFLVFGRARYDARAAVGMNNYLPVERVYGMLENGLDLDVEVFITCMKDRGYTPIFCEQGGRMLGDGVMQVLTSGIIGGGSKPCLVFGNEAIGITTEFMAQVAAVIPRTAVISIPQRGMCRSLNVSAAASILVWELGNAL
jgi:tRNA G18 (ribose-2'-O)-methylase SpoU